VGEYSLVGGSESSMIRENTFAMLDSKSPSPSCQRCQFIAYIGAHSQSYINRIISYSNILGMVFFAETRSACTECLSVSLTYG
jgi:hypothetical protein